MSTFKNILCIIATILLCVIFPPILIVVLPYTIYLLLTKNKGDRNHVGGKNWTNIDNIVIKNETNKRIFDFYKDILLDKVLNFEEAYKNDKIKADYKDIIEQEHNKIFGGLEKLMAADTKEEKILAAMRLESLNVFPSANNPQDVILNPREVCYYYTKSAAIDTIKKVRTNISYSGFKMTEGGFRLGNMSVSANSVEGIKRFDAGLLVITNQRIIFKGVNNHTKTISLGTIIGIERFEDNGVIIFLSNRETPIIIRFIANKTFFYNKKMDAMSFNNDLNWFERAISEIIASKTSENG